MTTFKQNRTAGNPGWYYAQLFFAALGSGVSVYLLVQHTRLTNGIQDSASFCSLGWFADCDVVNASRFSEFLGVPLASFGSCFYFVLLALGLMAQPRDISFRRLQTVIVWIGSVGLGIDLGLFILQLVALHTVCLMCLVTYLATIGVLFSSWKLFSKAPGKATLRSMYCPSQPMPPLQLSRNVLLLASIGLIALIAVVALIPNFIRNKSQSYTVVNNALEQFYQTWKDLPRKTIEDTEGDGVFGNPNAKVKIVEFSDFECPFCQKTAFTLHTLLGSLENRVYFVYKYFPLDAACNPVVVYQMHPQACQLARLGVCAAKKKKFWEYHDLVFLKLSEDQLKKGIDAISGDLKSVFSKDEITQCLNDDHSLQSTSADIKMGNALGLKGTPTVFINGKQVTIPISIETLNRLISIEESLSP